jgi:Tfp pilus assembly protein PilZ
MTKQKLPDSNLVVFVLASNLHCLRVIVIGRVMFYTPLRGENRRAGVENTL